MKHWQTKCVQLTRRKLVFYNVVILVLGLSILSLLLLLDIYSHRSVFWLTPLLFCDNCARIFNASCHLWRHWQKILKPWTDCLLGVELQDLPVTTARRLGTPQTLLNTNCRHPSRIKGKRLHYFFPRKSSYRLNLNASNSGVNRRPCQVGKGSFAWKTPPSHQMPLIRGAGRGKSSWSMSYVIFESSN